MSGQEALQEQSQVLRDPNAGRRTPRAPLALVLAAVATGTSAALCWRARRGRWRCARQPPADEPPAATLPTFVCEFVQRPGTCNLGQPSSPRPPPLASVEVVVAESVPLQGTVLGCGVPALPAGPPAADSSSTVKRLCALGARVVAQGTVQPFSYVTLGDNLRNPAAKWRVAGGGATGAVAAIAQGRASLAVAPDVNGSLRLPAACMGLPAFVATPGALEPAAQELVSAGFAAADTPLLCRVASLLGLPGPANLRHEVMQVVVAEDLFQLCEPELGPGLVAVKRAVLAWAGQEQAGSVQLLQFLQSNTAAWQQLHGAGVLGDALAMLPPVLAGVTRAAHVLHHAQLAAQYKQAAAGAQLQLEPLVAAAVSDGQAAGSADLAAARQVAQEVQELLRAAVRGDVVVVLPCTPAAPPRLDAPAGVRNAWLARCHAFSALTSLGACPCVVLPVGALPGGGPLSLALFGQARSDQRLLAVADKLAPHIQAELVKMQQATATAVAAIPQAQARSDRSGLLQATAGQAAANPRRAARAEAAKARGNEAYKAGRYLDAIQAYSLALQLQPGHPVYSNNRAMAYLKVFRFEAAEADCTTALAASTLAAADRAKALLRRGTARMHKADTQGAHADFMAVLDLEPRNRQALEELLALEQQV